MFGTDFREGSRRAAGEADVAQARSEGFQAGLAQARAEAQDQTGGLVARLLQSIERLASQDHARLDEVEWQAAQVAISTARRLAGAALADKPMAGLENAVRECLGHARLAPHLVVRVNEASVETVEGMLARLTRETGFAGKLVVLGEPDIAPGDGRIEWADGGFVVDQAKLGQLIDQAVESAFGAGRFRGIVE
ncbi:MAG: flagellar assembly protein FliH [Beijerinckiaceae bacterium]|nr:flagellar assembly protein FliH [Beijerinckiaceae bacterium]